MQCFFWFFGPNCSASLVRAKSFGAGPKLLDARRWSLKFEFRFTALVLTITTSATDTAIHSTSSNRSDKACTKYKRMQTLTVSEKVHFPQSRIKTNSSKTALLSYFAEVSFVRQACQSCGGEMGPMAKSAGQSLLFQLHYVRPLFCVRLLQKSSRTFAMF